jgi:hypothetical protein
MGKRLGSIFSFSGKTLSRSERSRRDKARADHQPQPANTQQPHTSENIPLMRLKPKSDRFQQGSAPKNHPSTHANRADGLYSFPRIPDWADYENPPAIDPKDSPAVQSLLTVNARPAKPVTPAQSTRNWGFPKLLREPLRWLLHLGNSLRARSNA